MCTPKKNLWLFLLQLLPSAPSLCFWLFQDHLTKSGMWSKFKWSLTLTCTLKTLKGILFTCGFLLISVIKKRTTKQQKQKAFPLRVKGSEVPIGKPIDDKRDYFGSKFVGCTRCFILLVCHSQSISGWNSSYPHRASLWGQSRTVVSLVDLWTVPT